MGREAFPRELAAKGGTTLACGRGWHPAAGSVCGIWIDRENGTLTAALTRMGHPALAW